MDSVLMWGNRFRRCNRFIASILLLAVLTLLAVLVSGSARAQFADGFESSTTGRLAAGDAARFLTQASFGPSAADIDSLVALGSYRGWLQRQFAAPTSWQLATMREINAKLCGDAIAGDALARHQAWWQAVLLGPDQLRQRVAFALSQILVVSDQHAGIRVSLQFGLADYYDVLLRHAFGNYRDLLEAVTQHPVMGVFLSMIKNRRAEPEQNIHPDENFAREVLQLFSIGVHQLRADGSLRLGGDGRPQPTYSQDLVQAFARVFTGWNYADIDYWWENGDPTQTMLPWRESHPNDPQRYHDDDTKTLLGGATNPAGLSTRDDLDAALDNIFNHANVAPFISQQLIQRLVTSNPSPAYVARVSAVFDDNGDGERGDLQAVITAILLDPEARAEYPPGEPFGKLREPLLRFSHLWRAIGAIPVRQDGSGRCASGGVFRVYQVPWYISNFQTKVGQQVLSAPSVFNFYRPDFSPPGPLREQGLIAPEFQLVTDSLSLSTANAINGLLHEPHIEQTALELSAEAALADNPAALLDHLNLLLLNQTMSTELRQILLRHLRNDAAFPAGGDHALAKATDAVTLIINSPEYLIQR